MILVRTNYHCLRVGCHSLTASLCIRQAVPGYRGTQRCARDYPFTASLLFFPQSLIGIVTPCRTPTPPMDKIVVACPLGRNNNDARGRAMYDRAITDPGGGTTHVCSSSTSKLMVWVSIVRHHLLNVVPPQMLQSGWCGSCSLSSAYRPPPHQCVLSDQSSSRSFLIFILFYFFSETQRLYVSICLSRW
jgi:hypothetical protein